MTLGAPASRRHARNKSKKLAGETPALPGVVRRFRGSKRESLFRRFLTPPSPIRWERVPDLSSVASAKAEGRVRGGPRQVPPPAMNPTIQSSIVHHALCPARQAPQPDDRKPCRQATIWTAAGIPQSGSHAAFALFAGIQKRCRRCALPPQSKSCRSFPAPRHPPPAPVTLNAPPGFP
jgi:hypothetical protein